MTEAQAGSADCSSRSEMRRRKIIDTARKLFVERGFHATGVAQIARGSGIAVGQMYRDFASKEDIVAALAKEDCAAFLQADTLKTAICRSDTDSTVTWLLALLELDDQNSGKKRLFAEIVAESARNDRIAAIFNAIQLELRATIMQALAQLAPDPALEDQRHQLTSLLLTFTYGLLHHQLMTPDLDVKPIVGVMRTIIRTEVEALASTKDKSTQSRSEPGPAQDNL